MSASSGSAVGTRSHNGINGSGDDLKLVTIQDSSGFYIFGSSYSDNFPVICKYILAAPISEDCYKFASLNNFAHSSIVILNKIFFMGIDSAAPFPLHMVRFTFGNTSVDWSLKTVCLSGTCGVGPSEGLSSIDGSKIYTFYIYSNVNYLYFVIIDSTTGAILSSRYKSSILCTTVNGSALNGDYLAANVVCSTIQLALLNLAASVFSTYSFTQSYLYGINVDSSSGRFIESGTDLLNRGYISYFLPNMIVLHSDFTKSTSFLMSVLGAGTEAINTETGILSTYSSEICNLASPPTSSATYHQYTSTISDLKGQTADQLFIVIENNSFVNTPDLTCSSSGTTSIIYAIGNCIGSTAPNWVTIDSSTGQLSISSPDLTADTDFCLIVNSVVSGIADPIVKKIKITVINCIALNCNKCSDTSSSICTQCATSYTLSSGTCTSSSSSTSSTSTSSSSSSSSSSSNSGENSTKVASNSETVETSQALTTTSQSIVGATAAVVTFVSIMNSSSIANLWSMINQSQMLFLLILTRAFIPIDVCSEITGSTFALNPSVNFPFKKIGIYRSFIENFNFGLSNPLLDPLGFKSDSIVYNNASNFILLAIVSIFHLFIYILNKLLSNCNTEGKCSCVIKIIVKLVRRIFEIMTFGYYIRFALELNQILLISSYSEIYLFSLSSSLKIISLVISFLMLFLCLGFIIIPIYLTFSSYKLEENEHNKLGDFFIGLKSQKKFKFYITLLLVRRLLFVTFLICLVTVNSKVLIGTLSFFQTIYIGYIIIARPFKEIKANLIEIMNEIYFFLLFGSLIFLNTQSDWNTDYSLIYMWVLASNSMAIFAVVFIDFVRMITLWIYRKCLGTHQSSEEKQIKITPKMAIRTKHFKYYEESKSQSNFENTPNPSTNQLKEESKFDLHEDASYVHMKKAKNWS